MNKELETSHDVVILGGGLSATVTALVLASKGLNVALLDNGTHPRFALGESLLKPTVLWMQLLADQYDLPELAVLANAEKINTQIAPTCGIKKGFGFVQHESGSDQIVDQWWANIAVSYGEGVSEAHYFRQDIDAYLFRLAVQRCANVQSNAGVQSVWTDSEGAYVETSKGIVSGQFLIDCTGPASKVAQEFDLREKPTRFKTCSRSIFTHMVDVVPFDECDSAPQPGLAWHDGTLHHILDEGWIWVIPFDNSTGSTNPVVSVGMTYDLAKSESSELTAEQEWEVLLQRYPALQRQFGNAKCVRPWISTGRLQYSAKSSVGERFCLLGAACGGVDALFSRGLLNTMQSISLVTEVVSSAIAENDFSGHRFEAIEKLQQNQLLINDSLTAGTYKAMGSSKLTTWWLSVWTLVEQKSVSLAQSTLGAWHDGSQASWELANKRLRDGIVIDDEELIIEVLENALLVMDKYSDGDADEATTVSALANCSVKLSSTGFNFPTYSFLLKDIGFRPRTRSLLQTEHRLAAMLDEVDHKLGNERQLRTYPFVMCLVKLISTMAASLDAENELANQPIRASLTLTGDELRERLRKASDTWVKDPFVAKQLGDVFELVKSLEYGQLVTDRSVDVPGELSPYIIGKESTGQVSIWVGVDQENRDLTRMRMHIPDHNGIRMIDTIFDKALLELVQAHKSAEPKYRLEDISTTLSIKSPLGVVEGLSHQA